VFTACGLMHRRCCSRQHRRCIILQAVNTV